MMLHSRRLMGVESVPPGLVLLPPVSGWTKVTGATRDFIYDSSTQTLKTGTVTGSNCATRTTSPITISSGTVIHIQYRINQKNNRQSQLKYVTLREADKNVSPATDDPPWPATASNMVNLNGKDVGVYEIAFSPSSVGQRYVAIAGRYYYDFDILKVWVTES